MQTHAMIGQQKNAMRLAGGRQGVRGCTRRGAVVVRALALPNEYGYVMASVAFTAAMCQWKAIRVSFARRVAQVKYPDMYAEGDDPIAVKFNCTQRAHQNTLESLPNLLAMQLVLGLKFPITAAVLGTGWALGRIGYALGYSTGDPSKRMPGGAVSGIIYLVFIVATAWAGISTALTL